MHNPRPMAEINAIPDECARRAAMAGNVPPDVRDAAQALLEAIDRHPHPSGGVPTSLYRIRRSAARFLEFADLGR